MRAIVTITALASVSFGVNAALAQSPAPVDAKAAIEGFLTDTALLGATSATVGTITETDGSVVASNVALKWDFDVTAGDETAKLAFGVTIPELTVDGLEATADGYRAALIAMPTLSGTMSGTADGKEPLRYDLTVSDYTFTNATWDKFPVIAADPEKPASRFAPLLDWSVSFAYDKSAISGLTGKSQIDGEVQDISYGALAFGPVVDGRLAAFEYGPVTVKQTVDTPGPDGEPTTLDLTMDYGVARGTGLDMKPFVALLTGNGVQPGPQPIMEGMTFDGMKVDGGGMFDLSMGNAAATDFAIDAQGVNLLAKLDPIILAGLSGQEPNPMQLVNLMLDVYGAFSIGSYAIDDVTVSADGGSFNLGKIALEGFSKNGIDLFSLTDMVVKSDLFDATLGAFTQAGLVFPNREAVMRAGFAAMAGAGPDPRLMMDVFPMLGELSIKGLSVSSPVLSSPVKVDVASIEMSDFIAPVPTDIKINLKGFEMPVALVEEPNAQAALSAMNADPLKIDGDIALKWDGDSQRVDLESDLAAANVGAIDLNATLSGIQRSVFEDPMTAQTAIATAALNSVSARFTNNGVADYLINMLSQQTGVAPGDFADAMATQAQMQISMMIGSQELATEVASAVRTFLSDPQNLSISASPASPLSFPELIGTVMTAPNALPGMLNFAISANN